MQPEAKLGDGECGAASLWIIVDCTAQVHGTLHAIYLFGEVLALVFIFAGKDISVPATHPTKH